MFRMLVLNWMPSGCVSFESIVCHLFWLSFRMIVHAKNHDKRLLKLHIQWFFKCAT